VPRELRDEGELWHEISSSSAPEDVVPFPGVLAAA